MNILITGQNGYIARRLYSYLREHRHDASLMNVRGGAWKNQSFTGADCIVHLAGIVHNRSASAADYQSINVKLTETLARKAKDEGVPQFIFVSTMAVYGKPDSLCPLNEINIQTPLEPKTPYGVSKLAGENAVRAVYGGGACIVRPPMVYGENCTGNYAALRSIALRFKTMPRYENRRGMLYTDNLCELLRLLIENRRSGIYCPQDTPLIPTHETARLIGAQRGVTVKALKILNPLLKAGSVIVPSLRKAFGSLSYSDGLSACGGLDYRLYSTPDAVARTEKYWH